MVSIIFLAAIVIYGLLIIVGYCDFSEVTVLAIMVIAFILFIQLPFDKYTEWSEINRTYVEDLILNESTVICETDDDVIELKQSDIFFLENFEDDNTYIVQEEREEIPNRWITLRIKKTKESRYYILIPSGD